MKLAVSTNNSVLVWLPGNSEITHELWLFRPFAGSPLALSPHGLFAPWLVCPLACSPPG